MLEKCRAKYLTMNFSSRESLRRYGFRGFIKVADLYESNCVDVPQQRGVYVVLRESPVEPEFLPVSPAGCFRGQDPTAPVDTLREKWVPVAKVLYIGKSMYLRKRVRMYIRFGYGAPITKWGGRYIWQLADSRDLLICWKILDDNDNPATEETRLISKFEQQYRKLPFANLRR